MSTRSMSSSLFQFDLVLLCVRAAIVISAALATTAWADSAAEKKILDAAMGVDELDANCKSLADGAELSKNSVYLKHLSNAVLSALDDLAIKKEFIEQVRVRMSDGRQYFLVLSDSANYRCKVPVQLPVTMVHPVEPLTDVRLEINPCCTYTYGGDALAQWFNLVNCPLSKPKKLAPLVCGH